MVVFYRANCGGYYSRSFWELRKFTIPACVVECSPVHICNELCQCKKAPMIHGRIILSFVGIIPSGLKTEFQKNSTIKPRAVSNVRGAGLYFRKTEIQCWFPYQISVIVERERFRLHVYTGTMVKCFVCPA